MTSTLANIERMKAMGTKMGKLTLDTVMKGLIGMSDRVRIVLAFTAGVMVFEGLSTFKCLDWAGDPLRYSV